MTTSNHCDAWYDLLFSKDRGKIYDQFNRERAELTKHLESCDICKKVIEPLLSEDIDQLEFFTPQEFAEIIREVYNNAQGANIKTDDDSVNTDHD